MNDTPYNPLTDYSAGDATSCGSPRGAGGKTLAKPTAKQLAFHDWELGLFIHFGLSTYSGQVSGDGKVPPTAFNPTDLDCDGWMDVAEAMGAKYVVMTARHEGGFCLWPTATAEYSVVNSPWRGGKGDVVRAFTDACRKRNLKAGLYHSSWHDAHHQNALDSEHFKKKGPDALAAFTELQCRQVAELLTGYGEIAYLWFDHHGCPGYGGLEFWKAIDRTVWKHQPDCLIFGADTWINGGHQGEAGDPLWYAQDTSDGTVHSRPPSADGDPWGAFYRAWETNTIFSGNWFWVGPEVKPVSFMIDRYYKSVGRGTNFLPNFAPDPAGRMTATVLERARAFGDEIRRRFGTPIAETSGSGPVVELDLTAPPAPSLATPPFTKGGKGPSTPLRAGGISAAEEKSNPPLIPLCQRGMRIDHVIIMEDLRDGQKIARHSVEALVGGQWREIARGNTVGHKRIHPVKPVAAEKVRFRCLEALAEPVAVRSLTVCRAD